MSSWREALEVDRIGRVRVAVAALVLAALVVAWSGALPWFEIPVERYGTLGEWVSGVGTVAAIAIALRESGLARRRERLDRLCAVTAWMELERHADGEPRWTVSVSNGTEHPIYEWLVVPRPRDGSDATWHLCAEKLGPLTPRVSQYEVPHETDSGFEAASPVELHFEDRDGQQWLRNTRGQLTAVAHPGESDADKRCEFCANC
jgi:hypothetical protein